jgi:thiol-disulfide isomerase/thioredoxin
MLMTSRFVLLLPLLVFAPFGDAVGMKNCPAEPRGWGEDIQWSSYLEGLRLGRETRKPIMLIVHKTWCGPCRALFPQCRRVYSKNMRFESDRLYFVRNNWLLGSEMCGFCVFAVSVLPTFGTLGGFQQEY